MNLNDAVKALKDLPGGKISIALGVATAALGVIQFRDDMVLLISLLATGLILVVIGLIMGVIRARAKERAKIRDLEFRALKMEKGLAPEDDKTVIKFD